MDKYASVSLELCSEQYQFDVNDSGLYLKLALRILSIAFSLEKSSVNNGQNSANVPQKYELTYLISDRIACIEFWTHFSEYFIDSRPTGAPLLSA